MQRVYLFVLLSIVYAQSVSADDSHWRNLLHLQGDTTTINEESFFFSPYNSGKIDPEAELIATVRAFRADKENICKFPARYKWLHSHYNFSKEHNCPELQKYLQPHFTSLSLIFTAPRYDAPSSLFGHTFLKVYSDTIAYAINYAAKVPDDISSIVYAYRGIAGDFNSSYKLLAFTSKEYEYQNGEYRDLIEYELNLSEDAVNTIMLHLYELRGVSEDYYFFNHNCSSELLKLLALSQSELEATKSLGFITIPISIITLLEEKKLIKSYTVSDSIMKQFYKSIALLTQREKDIVDEIIHFKQSVYSFEKDSTFTTASKSRIVAAALIYLGVNEERENLQKSLATLFKLIQLKSRLKPVKELAKKKSFEHNPIGEALHRVSLATHYSREQRKEINLAYRFLYKSRFDLLDSLDSYGSVALFDLSLRSIEGSKNRYSLDYFTLLNVESTPLSNDYYHYLGSKITIGLQRLFFEDDLYSYATYSLNYSREIMPHFSYELEGISGLYYDAKTLASLGVQTTLRYHLRNFISDVRARSEYYFNTLRADTFSSHNYLKVSKSVQLQMTLSQHIDSQNYYSAKISLSIFY